jgi:hypothetical protein
MPKYLLPGQDEHPSAETFQAALPILWSFLLEPGRIKDPTSEEPCVDFKSIASLLFVNTQAKEAFDACNGRIMCVRAWKKEAAAREGYINENITRIKATFRNQEWSQHATREEKLLFNSLRNEVESLFKVARRLRFILVEQLCGHFAAEYDPENQLTANCTHIVQNLESDD